MSSLYLKTSILLDDIRWTLIMEANIAAFAPTDFIEENGGAGLNIPVLASIDIWKRKNTMF